MEGQKGFFHIYASNNLMRDWVMGERHVLIFWPLEREGKPDSMHAGERELNGFDAKSCVCARTCKHGREYMHACVHSEFASMLLACTSRERSDG